MPEAFAIDLTVDRNMVKDVLRAVVNAILFHRVFGNIKPKSIDLLDLTFPAIDDDEIARSVDEKVQAFSRHMDSNALPKSQLAVLFLEKRAKRAWFSTAEEEICWEQWTITLDAVNAKSDRDRNRMHDSMERQLEGCLMQIIRIVNEKKDHIPPIVTNEANPFPYQIVIPTALGEGWVGSVLKRIIDQP